MAIFLFIGIDKAKLILEIYLTQLFDLSSLL